MLKSIPPILMCVVACIALSAFSGAEMVFLLSNTQSAPVEVELQKG